MKHYPIWAGLFIGGMSLLACQSSNSEQPQTTKPDSALTATRTLPTPDTPAPSTRPTSVTIIGVGDMMIGSNYPDSKGLPPNDGKGLLDHVAPYLRDADITFGNLEGVLLTKGGTPKACGDSKYCYTFRMPEHYVNYFVDAGFDVMAVANNHANDFGSGGRENTAKTLAAAGLHFAGSVEKPYTTFEKDGLKYGFVAAAPNSGCFSSLQYDKVAETVRMLDSICDIVIVSLHAGAEGVAYRHTPCKDETFLGMNRGNVCKFAKTAIDAGGDIVFGHGPHVTRGVELYKDRFIIYSMGNFCTYDKFNIQGSKGVGPIVKLKVSDKGEFQEGWLIPTRQHDRGVPKYDSTNMVINEIIELSTADFPNSPLVVEKDGRMKRK